MLDYKPSIPPTVRPSGLPVVQSVPHIMPRESAPRTFAPDASLVLVGIRGCGKRSLGFVAATALKRRFITEDHYFREVTGVTRQDYLKSYGSQEFQRRDIEVLKMMLENHRTGCVMECGLGSLTRPVQDHLRRYARSNPVVHLLRDIDRIQQLLGLEDQAVRLFREGDPMHRMCSNFELQPGRPDTRGGRREPGSSIGRLFVQVAGSQGRFHSVRAIYHWTRRQLLELRLAFCAAGDATGTPLFHPCYICAVLRSDRRLSEPG